MPFLETPDTARFSNNKSAINNSNFTENSIKKMLATGIILEPDQPLRVVNFLSMSINSSKKRHLILDMRHVNMYLYKDRIEFDDWKCFENYLLADKGYLFQFDFKNGYQHIDIFDSHQTYFIFRLFLGYQKGYKIFLIHCPKNTKNQIFFFQMFCKDVLSKKIALEYDLSCIIRKDDISFPQKYYVIL